MNPNGRSSFDQFQDVFGAWVEADRAVRKADANAALEDLCDALGVELAGATFDRDYGKVTLPVDRLALITARLRALADGDALSEGVL